MKFLSISLFAACVVFAGCSSSTSPSSVVIPKSIVPGPGSYYKYQLVYRDSTDAVAERDTMLVTVADTGLVMFGKTGVIKELRVQTGSKGNTSRDTAHIHYEPNGDYSVYIKPPSYTTSYVAGWFTYPFASQQTVTQQYTVSPGDYTDSITQIYTGSGTGSFTVNGVAYVTEKLLRTGHTKSMRRNAWVMDTSVETIQYAPQVGRYVESDYPAFRETHLGSLVKSYRSELIEFELK
jgi:hypothetical protein